MADEFYSLKESLKEYKLPYAYGELAYAAFDYEPEEQEEEEQDWQEDAASFADMDSVDDPACPITQMFAEAKANANSLITNAS
jgi:hypothetical protein